VGSLRSLKTSAYLSEIPRGTYVTVKGPHGDGFQFKYRNWFCRVHKVKESDDYYVDTETPDRYYILMMGSEYFSFLGETYDGESHLRRWNWVFAYCGNGVPTNSYEVAAQRQWQLFDFVKATRLNDTEFVEKNFQVFARDMIDYHFHGFDILWS
jgi:hypothetical protein